MTLGAVTQLGYLCFSVSDVPAWESFATQVLGMSAESSAGSSTPELRIDDHSFRFVLESGSSDDLQRIGWQVAGPAELHQIEQRLSALGVSCEPGADELARLRRVGGLLRVPDPSGLMLEIYWGPEVVVGSPMVPGRPINGFKAGQLGLGHVVLAVEDVAACVGFYCDVLGFRLSDYGNGPFTFLRCNARHHSIAFGPARALRSEKLLQHFMVEMLDIDDVGTAYDICEERGIPIAITLGRHTNDRMFSFYAQTPSGFRFECGHGGLLVGDDWEVRRYREREVWGHRRLQETLRDTPATTADPKEPMP
jgi:2,3-dihydroxybiphenyl 1,2-dioxygenase